MIRRLVAGVIALVFLSGMAASSASASPVLVSLSQCDRDGGATVQAGDPVSLILAGFAQGTHGLVVDFLIKQRTTLTIVSDDTPTVVDLTHTYSTPQQLDVHLWATRPANYDLGTLASGQEVLVTQTITFAQPLLVAFPPVTSSGDNGPFLTHAEPPISCLITTV